MYADDLPVRSPSHGFTSIAARGRTGIGLLALAAFALPAASPCQCSNQRHAIGALVDRGSTSLPRAPWVHVFDPDTQQILGTVPLPTASVTGVFDIEISPDLREAYVGDNNNNQVWFIDLTTTPPSVIGGQPLQLSGGCLDLALSSDCRWLLAGSGNGVQTSQNTALVVIDVHNRVEASRLAYDTTASPTAVEFAPDGSVLVAEVLNGAGTASKVHRYRLDATGTLIDTGEFAATPQVTGVQDLLVPSYPQLPAWVNAFLARNVVYVSRPAGQTLGSLQLHQLLTADSLTLDYPTGIDLNFDPLRSIVYVRTIESPSAGPAGIGNSRIDGYLFNPFTGQFLTHVVTIPLDRRAGTAYGCEQTALDPVGRRIFVAGLAGGEVRVFDSLRGTQVGTMTSPDLIWPLGIAVRRN